MMPKESEGDFGRYLQEGRLARGRSLDDIAQQTKINASCLHQIENEDLDSLPQDAFVRGFLKTYAEAVGVDAKEVLRRYQIRCGIQQQIELAEQTNSSGRSFRLRLIFALLLLSSALGISLYLVQKGRSADVADNKMGVAEAPLRKEGTQPTQAATGPQVEIEAATDSSPALNLRVSAVAHTRLKIIADAGLPQEFDLQQGEQIALAAEKHLNLLISNAGGIRLMLNDKPVAVPGKNGQVITMNLP